MKTPDEKPKVWQTTREPNLLKNVTSGRFYARFKIAGKAKWLNLDTDVWSVALLRIADERGKIVRTRMAQEHVASGVATMGELSKTYREQLDQVPETELSVSTKTRYKEHLAMVEKTWPDFASIKPERITKGAVISWRNRIAKDGSGFRPPGAKGRSKLIDGSSSGSINKSIDAIRRLLQIAVDGGQLPANPLAARDSGIKLDVTPRKPTLPAATVMEELFNRIEAPAKGRGVRSAYCGELCRFLAYTGCRLSEAVGDPEIGAKGVNWGDVDFEGGFIQIHGTKTDAADREVPLIPKARALLETIRARRLAALGDGATLDPKSKVLLVSEASKALARACVEVGCERLTHHDLRDAFTTACLEKGILIPVLAAWLGHKDGGALLMKTYAHHRRAHSLAEAGKFED